MGFRRGGGGDGWGESGGRVGFGQWRRRWDFDGVVAGTDGARTRRGSLERAAMYHTLRETYVAKTV
jgi:hypothetical protein